MSPTPPAVSAEDQLALTDLFARYCAYLDRHDVEGWVGLFTEDAAYEVYGRTFAGHDGLRTMMTNAPYGLHLGGVPVIDPIDRDRVRVMQSLLFYPVGDEAMRRALYTDEVVRTADGWRIAKRRCDFITDEGIRERP